MEQDERLTVKAAAAALGLSEAGVRWRLRHGLLKGDEVAPGRYWLVPRAEVERYRGVGPFKRGRKPKEKG